MAIIHCSLWLRQRFFPKFNLEQNQKADFIAAPFRRDLPQARRSQSRNEIIARAVTRNSSKKNPKRNLNRFDI